MVYAFVEIIRPTSK